MQLSSLHCRGVFPAAIFAMPFSTTLIESPSDAIDALTPTVLGTTGVSDPDAFAGSRVPLVGTFTFNGEAVTVVNNHFSSRFGSTPIFGGPSAPFVPGG